MEPHYLFEEGALIVEQNDEIIANEEQAFKSSLWRLYSQCILRQFESIISNEVNKTYQESIANGITNFQDWMRSVLNDNIGKKNKN